MAEADFPRGGAKSNTNTNNNNNTNVGAPTRKNIAKPSGSNKKKSGGPRLQQHGPPTLNTKFSSITPQTLHSDMLLLGSVNSLRLNEVVVELPLNMKGVLTGYDPAHFTLGQCVAVGVTGPPVTHLESAMLPLTIQPSSINRSLEIVNLRPGMYLSGIVSSVEDRGYSVDTAITDAHSFIAKTHANLTVGQPVFSVITDVSISSKRIFLTPQQDSEAAFKDIKDWKSVSLEHVRPGNATKAEVIRKYINGLGVRIYNQPTTSPLSAFIPATHLPQPVDYYSIGFRMNGKILYVDYRSQSVMVTVLPHIVTHKPSVSLYGDYVYLRNRTFSVPIPPVERPMSIIPTKPPTQALIVSVANLGSSTTEIKDSSVLSSKDEADVRVVGVSFLLNSMIASADPLLVEDENAVLDIIDLYPGMPVNGLVTAVSKTGIEVQLSPSIRNATCQSDHLTDASSLQNIKAIFKENEQIQCRVLYISDDETVFITNKPTLVNSSLHLITSYHNAFPGCVAHGWISKVTRSEVFVSFYNNVTGVVPLSDIKGTPDNVYRAGEVVVCQVIACNEPKAKTNNHSLILTFDVQLANSVPSSLNISVLRKAFSSVNVGEVVSGIISHTDLNGLTLVLESGITGIIPKQHLSDSQAACTYVLSRYYIGTKMDDILVLNKDSANMRLVLSKKSSLKSLNSTNFKSGEVIPAHVKQISDSSITVGFLGTSKATVLHSEQHATRFELGQSVRVAVRGLDTNGSPTVDLFDSTTKTDGVLLLREYFSAVDGLFSRTKMAKMRVGTIVSGCVVGRRSERIVIRLENQLLAYADSYLDANARHFSQGSTVKGVVIDIDYLNATVQLSLDEDIVNNITDPVDIPAGKVIFGVVMLANAIYLVVCATHSKNKRSIVFVPGCDYNTQGSSHSVAKIGQEILVLKEIAGEKAEKRPLFSIKGHSSPVANGTEGASEEVEEAEDGTEQDESDGSVMSEEELDDASGAVFEYLDESDDEPPSDIDDLQAYLDKTSHEKAKMKPQPTKTQKIGGTKTQKGGKHSTKQKGDNLQTTRQKPKRKVTTTYTKNKKSRKN